tara:strand:+ start:192 stop:398 length:207 start_codon:yes stop_codon:yes gene_type:complete
MRTILEITMKNLFCLILLALSATAMAHHEATLAQEHQASVALLLMMFIFLVGSITITLQSYFNKTASE